MDYSEFMKTVGISEKNAKDFKISLAFKFEHDGQVHCYEECGIKKYVAVAQGEEQIKMLSLGGTGPIYGALVTLLGEALETDPEITFRLIDGVIGEFIKGKNILKVVK